MSHQTTGLLVSESWSVLTWQWQLVCSSEYASV